MQTKEYQNVSHFSIGSIICNRIFEIIISINLCKLELINLCFNLAIIFKPQISYDNYCHLGALHYH